MTWWGWIVSGTVLLAAELALVDAQFYLVLVGSAAIATGLVVLALPALPEWTAWGAFAALALALTAGFRARLYTYLRGRLPEVGTDPVGGTLTLPAALAPGASCRVEYRGSSWTARNDGEATIAAGAVARVRRVQGLTLSVAPDA